MRSAITVDGILGASYPRNPEPTNLDVVDLVIRPAEWSQINFHIEQKTR